MIRITYVTVTYNAANVLQRTLDSVLQQDYPEIVHLIIDGASTDDTLRLVETYIERSNAAENGHRIQMMSEPDKGIYDAMNKGLRSLDGDYVCFLNAGDFLPASDTVSRIVLLTMRSCRLCSMVIPISLTAKGTFCTTVVSLHQRICRGNHSVRVCWCAIRLSMRVPILPLPHLTIPITAILQM